ncbi:MAG: hypothetical protein KY462_13750 [Actinobacteria bacterium]|nr:hypothetical protein [Actinomycetota bacterium]
MQGLRYPRNVLAHESEAWEFGTADVYIDVYTNIYGVWVWTDLGPPRRAVDSVLAQHAAYHTRLAGQPVITTTRQALAMLEEYWNR